jgi:hypothetical protein
MERPTRFIGMDVHKDTIVVAVTAAGDVGKATPYGTFPNTGDPLLFGLASPLVTLARASTGGCRLMLFLGCVGRACLVLA